MKKIAQYEMKYEYKNKNQHKKGIKFNYFLYKIMHNAFMLKISHIYVCVSSLWPIWCSSKDNSQGIESYVTTGISQLEKNYLFNEDKIELRELKILEIKCNNFKRIYDRAEDEFSDKLKKEKDIQYDQNKIREIRDLYSKGNQKKEEFIDKLKNLAKINHYYDYAEKYCMAKEEYDKAREKYFEKLDKIIVNRENITEFWKSIQNDIQNLKKTEFWQSIQNENIQNLNKDYKTSLKELLDDLEYNFGILGSRFFYSKFIKLIDSNNELFRKYMTESSEDSKKEIIKNIIDRIMSLKADEYTRKEIFDLKKLLTKDFKYKMTVLINEMTTIERTQKSLEEQTDIIKEEFRLNLIDKLNSANDDNIKNLIKKIARYIEIFIEYAIGSDFRSIKESKYQQLYEKLFNDIINDIKTSQNFSLKETAERLNKEALKGFRLRNDFKNYVGIIEKEIIKKRLTEYSDLMKKIDQFNKAIKAIELCEYISRVEKSNLSLSQKTLETWETIIGIKSGSFKRVQK